MTVEKLATPESVVEKIFDEPVAVPKAGAAPPVKIIYLITELNIGGAEKVLVHFLHELDRSRYSPTVACLFAGDGAIGDELRAGGVPVVDLGMSAQWRLDAFWRLVQLLRQERPQILHSSLFHANVLGRLAGRLAKVPVIISCRQNIRIGARWREWVNRLTIGLDDRIIAVCELARQAEIEQAHVDPAKVVTIYNAVDPSRLETRSSASQNNVPILVPGLSPDTLVIGTACRFHPQKGLPYLLEAFAQLRQRSFDVHLVLMGDGELRKELENHAYELGVYEHVTFTGFRRDIDRVLPQLDLFVLPSLWEGLPMVLLEAMSAGLPVVATRVGGTPELVQDGETGLLVPPEDAAALADAMQRLLEQDDLRRSMGQRGRQRVEGEFSAAHAVRQTTALYEELRTSKGLTRSSK